MPRLEIQQLCKAYPNLTVCSIILISALMPVRQWPFAAHQGRAKAPCLIVSAYLIAGFRNDHAQ